MNIDNLKDIPESLSAQVSVLVQQHFKPPVKVAISVVYDIPHEKVASVVCKEMQCSLSDLGGFSKVGHATISRLLFCWICRVLLGSRLEDIAHIVGKDRTTVITAVTKMNGYIDVKDPIVYPHLVNVLNRLLYEN